MKNLTISMAMLLAILCFNVQAQYVTVSDTAFVRYLTDNYPSCMSGNQMDTTCTNIVNESYIYISGYQVSDISSIRYFRSAETLVLLNSPLFQTLDILPPRLKWLSIDHCDLQTVTQFSDSLQGIALVGNQLTSLPAFPDSLKELVLDTNTTLSNIPPLPDGLRLLSLPYCYFTEVPPLPAGLQTLNMDYNPIDSLPPLPATLEGLDIGQTLVDRIPPLPNGLKYLNCSECFITDLPALPDSLERLYCFGNFLTELPPLPSKLNWLNCNGNQLTSIPPVPHNMRELIIGNNPLLCLPVVDTVNYMDFLNVPTSSLCRSGPPATFTNYSIPNYNSLPRCDIWNPGGCPIPSNINGMAYLDGNGNCEFDNLDKRLAGVKVQLFQSGQLMQQTYTDSFGSYSFDIQGNYGTYEVSIDSSLLAYSVNCPDTGYHSTNLTASSFRVRELDFGLGCGSVTDIGVTSITAPIIWFRPASVQTIRIHAGDLSNLYGGNCASGVSAQVIVVMTGSAHSPFSTGTLNPSSTNGDTLIWDIADLDSVDLFNSFQVSFQIDTYATFNDSVCFDVFASSLTPDADSTNDHLSMCLQVQTSYDPNDKQVSPLSIIDTSQEWLNYTIRFQNTGTAPAQHVRVEDTLSSYLDFSTFQVLNASHYNITEVSQYGVVNFNFPNIELPDSNFDEPNSHGFVNYKIKLKDNLPIGNTIENTAHIYFDFNPAIVTNTTTNTIVQPLKQPIINALNVDACIGDTITLETALDNSYTYTWLLNGTDIPNTNMAIINVYQSGNYSVRVTDGIFTETSDPQTVTINPLPTVTFTLPTTPYCEGDDAVELSGTGSPAGGIYSGSAVSNDMLNISTAGTLTVEYTYTDGNGCTDSKQANAIVEICEGIEELQALGINVYPNPASNTIWISLTNNIEVQQVKLIDLSGKEVATATTTNNGFSIDVSNLPSQTYLLIMSNKEGKIITSSSIQVAR